MLQTKTTPLGIGFVKLYCNNKEIPYPIERFQYTYSEESDDSCTVTLNTIDPKAADNPVFHDLAIWTAIWGFVNGQTKQRKMYLQDSKWSYTKSGRKMVLNLSEQAVVLKQGKSKQTFSNVTIVDAAKLIAEKKGLNLVIIKPNTTGFVDEGYVWIAATGGSSVNGATIDSNAIAQKKWQAEDNKEANDFQKALATDNPYLDLAPLKNYPFKVQANKTDSHVLTEMGDDEPASRVVVETRDNNLILKKRNFNKKPYRSYTYGADTEFFNFEPETKNRSKAGAAVATMMSAWDKKKKEFTHMTLALESTKTYLAKYLRTSGYVPNMKVVKVDPKDQAIVKSDHIKWTGKFKDGFLYIPFPGSQRELQAEINTQAAASAIIDSNNADSIIIGDFLTQQTTPSILNNGSRVDNTKVTYTTGKQTSTIGEVRNILSKAIETMMNSQHDPTIDGSMEDALQSGINDLENSNLQMNPATGLFWGDVNHETGIILTLLVGAKKHSGNYYIVKSTHTLEMGAGYTVHDEFCTQGSNLKMPTNQSAQKSAQRSINTEIGKAHNNKITHHLKTTTNKR